MSYPSGPADTPPSAGPGPGGSVSPYAGPPHPAAGGEANQYPANQYPANQHPGFSPQAVPNRYPPVPHAAPYPVHAGQPAGYAGQANVVHHVHHGVGTKDTTVALLLWFFLGTWGVDQFYLGRIGSGIGVIVLNVLGWMTFWFGLGFVLWFALFVWWVVNGCLTPGRVREHNLRLAAY